MQRLLVLALLAACGGTSTPTSPAPNGGTPTPTQITDLTPFNGQTWKGTVTLPSAPADLRWPAFVVGANGALIGKMGKESEYDLGFADTVVVCCGYVTSDVGYGVGAARWVGTRTGNHLTFTSADFRIPGVSNAGARWEFDLSS